MNNPAWAASREKMAEESRTRRLAAASRRPPRGAARVIYDALWREVSSAQVEAA